MFKCGFSPCSYESKRESNLRQHMEKAHGWINSNVQKAPGAPFVKHLPLPRSDDPFWRLPSDRGDYPNLLENHDLTDNEDSVVHAKDANDFDFFESSQLKQNTISETFEPRQTVESPHTVTSIKKKLMKHESERRLLEEDLVRRAREKSPKRKAVGQLLA